jgi:hypothetical protein
MAFHTVVAIPPTLQPALPHRYDPQSLVRPIDHTFTPLDFAAYEDSLSFFFRHRGARAALLQGGVIWRLAYERVNPGIILDGPEAVTQAAGYRLVEADTPGNILVDDELTTAEIWLLIGGYQVPTTNVHQDVMVSWWPRLDQWERSGMGAGFWSPLAEQYYQRRLADCRSGKTGPLPRKAWERSIVNYDRRVRRAYRAYEDAARQVLHAAEA